MALPHAAPGEPQDVRPYGATLAKHQTSALFKSEHVEVIRLVLPTGKTLPPHKVQGDITLQCIEGELAVEALGATTTLSPGQLLFLAGGQVHAVKALHDASALLTIVLAGDD